MPCVNMKLWIKPVTLMGLRNSFKLILKDFIYNNEIIKKILKIEMKQKY